MAWCTRCGADLPSWALEVPCEWCWTGQADAALARALVDRAVGGSKFEAREANHRLAAIIDPDAAPVQSAVLHEGVASVRAAALRGLGRSGTREDVALVASYLDAHDPSTRSAARVALAELGGTVAANALADRLAVLDGDEACECAAELAWLRDARATAPLQALLADALDTPPTTGETTPAWMQWHAGYAWVLVRALLHVGSPAQIEGVKARAIDEARRRDRAMRWYAALGLALRYAGRPEDELLDWCEQDGLAINRSRPERASGPGVVERLTLAELSETPVDASFPAAKFGGQPDWRDTPQWPIASDGRPLTFHGQLPLDDSRTAYIFINGSHDVETWEPLGDGNAVVIQPGPPSHLPSRPLVTGPRVYLRRLDTTGFEPRDRHVAYERFVRLQAGADPIEWDVEAGDTHADWNKIGGTPMFLQGEHTPPGPGWTYAFQFTPGWATHELGDGAQCYGFVRETGEAALTWDCH